MQVSKSRFRSRFRAALLASAVLPGTALAQGGAPVDLGEVVVTSPAGRGYAPKQASVGSKEAVPLLEVPNSVSVITRQRMNDQNLRSVDEALKQVPGVSVIPWNGSTSQIWSRGYLADVMYDGVPSYNGSPAENMQFDLSIYEQVEMLKGPAGLIKGVSNPGSTVNLVRKRGLTTPTLEVTGSLGSWENYNGSIDAGGALNADGSVRSRLVLSRNDRGFWYRPTQIERNLAYGALDIDVTDRTTLSLSATWQESDASSPSMGLPAYTDGRFLDVPRSTHVYPAWNRMTFDNLGLSAELRHEFENRWVASAKVNYREQAQFWKDSFPAPNIGVDPATMTTAYLRRSADWDSTFAGIDAYVSGPVEAWGKEHILTLGYNHEINGSKGKTVSLPQVPGVSIFNPDIPEPDIVYTNGPISRTTQGGLYGQARIRVTDPLLFVVGGRLSHFDADSRTGAPAAETEWKQGAKANGEFTPYAGLIYYLTPNVTAYASYSDIFIPQNARTFSGALLDPRIGSQIEAGLKASLLDGNLNASLAAFRTHDVNRSMPDPDNPGFSIQAGKVEVRGIEAELSGNPLPNLIVSAGYTWQDTTHIRHQTMAGQTASLFEPEHSIKAYARYSFGDPETAKWTVGGGVTYSSGMKGEGGKLRRQDGYAVLDAQVDYRFNANVTASLQVTNIFDEKYYARVGTLAAYNVYGEPRAATFTLRSKF